MRWPSRLRWQLTLSHLAATAVTLVAMIGAAVTIGSLVFSWRAAPERQPAQDARLIARAVEGLVGNPTEMGVVLRALAERRLRLPGAAEQYAPDPQRAEWMGTTLGSLRYAVAIGVDGRVLASSDPAGAAFEPPERVEWHRGAEAALAERRGDGVLVPLSGRSDGPAVLGAAPVLDASGRAVAAIVVAESAPVRTASAFSLLRALAIFGVASVVVLVVASAFAVTAAGVVAYMLSRRLIRRLERLGGAAEALAAGDLTRRIGDREPDELGQLGRRFDGMAVQLARSRGEIEAERDRVAGLLDAHRQLVASVSHELRTPVATVRGYLESALARDDVVDGRNAPADGRSGPADGRSGAIPADLRGDLEVIDRETARLHRLIDDLFALSRAEVGRLALRLEPIDLGALVRRLVETAAPLAWAQRKVELLADLEAGLPPARADAQRVEQIVSNLLSNALRHTPPGGLIAVAVAAEPDALRIEVRDTGEGIPAEELPRVFERFYRGRGDGDEPAGAGLGLALVRELAAAMGGSVEASSVPGEGSRFAIRLPRA